MLYPSTICRYCSDTKKNANIAKNCRNSETDPDANPWFANSRGSRSGDSAAQFDQTNPTRNNTPTAMLTSVIGSDQPRSGPSMIANTSSPMPIAETTEPSGSKRTRSVARVDGTTAMIPTRVTSAIPAVTRKIDPQ